MTSKPPELWGDFNSRRHDFWGEQPDHPEKLKTVDYEAKTRRIIEGIDAERITSRAAYYMQLADGGLKPWVIRSEADPTFNVPLTQEDAEEMAALQLVLEDRGVLYGEFAVRCQELRDQYAPLFLYSLKEEDADKPHMSSAPRPPQDFTM